MLYVQKDLSAVTKAVLDNWDARKDELNYRYLYVANARLTPRDILASVKKRTSRSSVDDGSHATTDSPISYSRRQRRRVYLPAKHWRP